MNFKLVALLCSLYFFSFCTPYWENESLQELDHDKITQQASEEISLNNKGNFQSDNNLSTSAQKLEVKTDELSEEIDHLLNNFNEEIK